MGITPFFAAASNLRGELQVNRVAPSTRMCVDLHPGGIGNLISKSTHQCDAIFRALETFGVLHGNSQRIGRNRKLNCRTERQPRSAASDGVPFGELSVT
jgi:hypothetical protein